MHWFDDAMPPLPSGEPPRRNVPSSVRPRWSVRETQQLSIAVRASADVGCLRRRPPRTVPPWPMDKRVKVASPHSRAWNVWPYGALTTLWRYSALQLQGMDRTPPWRQRFVEPPPDNHRAKQRGNRGAMLATSTRGLALEPQARRRLVRAVGLEVIQDPGDHTAANLSSKCAELPLKGGHLLRGRLVVQELINPTTSLECIDKICPCRITVLRSQATEESGF